MQNWLQDYSDFCGNYGLIVSALHNYEFSVHYLHPNETRKPRLTSMTVKKTHIQYTHRINIMASHGISACNTCFLKTYIQRIQHAPSNVSSKSIKPTLTVSARFKFCNIFGSWERFTSSQRGHMGVSKCSLLDSYFLPTPAFQRPPTPSCVSRSCHGVKRVPTFLSNALPPDWSTSSPQMWCYSLVFTITAKMEQSVMNIVQHKEKKRERDSFIVLS